MPFALFREYFRELAEQETRTVTLLQDADGLPAGEYGFLEMFCDEPGCDCRRVMLQVFSLPRQQFEAVIAFGWERPKFYAKWLGHNNPEDIAELRGPVLNLGSPRTQLAPAVLALAQKLLLDDARYVARLQRHYALMRSEVERRAGAGTTAPSPIFANKVSRNAPCPCGSGRKYKKCCLSAPNAGGEEHSVTSPANSPASSNHSVSRVDEVGIQKEVDYIVRSAADGIARVVRLGNLVLFSTPEGDAWVLDTEDGCALPIGREGERLPARIFESEHKFVVEWTHDYYRDDDEICAVDRMSGEEWTLSGALVAELFGS